VTDPWEQPVQPRRDIETKRGDVHDEYEVAEEIGVGAFGVVHRCVEKATGNVFAAKFVKTHGDKAKETVRREIRVMSELGHPSLINLHDAFETDDEIVMVYEL